jgi:hypothetical protein
LEATATTKRQLTRLGFKLTRAYLSMFPRLCHTGTLICINVGRRVPGFACDCVFVRLSQRDLAGRLPSRFRRCPHLHYRNRYTILFVFWSWRACPFVRPTFLFFHLLLRQRQRLTSTNTTCTTSSWSTHTQQVQKRLSRHPHLFRQLRPHVLCRQYILNQQYRDLFMNHVPSDPTSLSSMASSTTGMTPLCSRSSSHL